MNPLEPAKKQEINAMTAIIEKPFAVALIAALLMAPGYSMAADATELPSHSVDMNAGTTVHFADLDLSKPAGLARLYERISRTASDICGAANGSTSLRERCMTRTIEDAIDRINKPPLTALHAEHLRHAVGS
jgi:UrcA family protein